MIRKALLLGLILASCAPAVASSDASDAPVFETSAESAVPPLPNLDASTDAGSDAGLDGG